MNNQQQRMNNNIQRAANNAQRAANNSQRMNNSNQVTNNVNQGKNNANQGKNNNKSETGMLNSVKQTLKEQTETMSPLTIFIIVLIVIVLIYISVNYLYSQIVSSRPVKVSKNVLVDVVTDGMTELEIGSNEMPNSSYSNEYSLSLWVYVDNFDYKHGERKFILRRGDIRSTINPEIYIHPTQNKLQVNVSLATDIHGTPATSTTTTTTAAETTTTTTSAETTTTTAVAETATFQNIEGFQVGEFEERNISAVSDDKFVHNIANHYNSSFYNSVVNSNEVEQQTNSILETEMIHNPELDVVLEQFGSSDADCDCDGTAKTGETEAERAAFEEKCGKCFVEDFPLQKWVHLVVSQYNNVIDIYVDGKLHSSCSLPGFPDPGTGSLVLSPEGGYSGQMSSVVYVNSAMSQGDVYKMYAMGPDGARNSSGVLGKLRSVPTWVYIVVVVMIIAAVAYSFFM
jgi:hypothetical protein